MNEQRAPAGATADHYADGTYRWWHLPPPELLAALDDGWLPSDTRPLDVLVVRPSTRTQRTQGPARPVR